MTFIKGARWLRTKLQHWKSHFSVKMQSLNWKESTQSKFRSMVQKDWKSSIKRYRMHMLKGVGSIGLVAAITIGGNHYVKANMVEVFHVYVDGQEVGTVSNPKVVDDYKINKVKELEQQKPNVHMVLNTDAVTLKSEKAFKLKSDDTAALAKLNESMTTHAVGVQLVVDGKLIGIVKDKDEANVILDQIKAKYLPAKPKSAGLVSILSADRNAANAGESQIEKVDFVQKVEINPATIDPNDLMAVSDVVKKLQTGDVQPKKYKVVKGDCVSCIAQKFNISKQMIYKNNPTLADDVLNIGQELDLTVLQPTLSVKTVEKVVENQEVQFDTNYTKDSSLRAGVVNIVTPGKNGMKKVTFELTKVDGLMEDEQMLSEEIVTPPVSATAIKGTKVIQGEGTGKFAWPVIGASISSGFGNRWGKFHKGVDLTGNKTILAADNGKVIYAGFTSDYGNHVIIDHMNGYKTVYAHLSQFSVTVGKVVEKGDKVGVMGSTGDATGVHLHFEVRRDDNPENPLKYLNR
ncbi:MAG: rane protein [Bacilli bacterium]|nr:rane protein [Bacilli bacterium]